MGKLVSELRKKTVGRRKVFSRILGVLCLANLMGLLFAGLWPFDFSPENKASWDLNGKGLSFTGNRTSFKRSVGSIALWPVLKGSPRVPPETGAFTLSIRLQPARERRGSAPHIFSLVDKSGEKVLYLGQWGKSLLVRWREAGREGGGKWREIGVGEALLKDKAQGLTIATDRSGTVVYINGQAARRFPGKSLLAEGSAIRDYSIVLGNSPEAKSFWAGTISALALYEKSLAEKEILEGWRGPAGSFLDASSGQNGLIASFKLEGGPGDRGSDLSGNGNVLEIPSHISVRGRMLEGVDNSFRAGMSLTSDAVVNVLGFIPFGFFVFWWFKIRGRWNRGRLALLVVLGGGLVSLAIEMTQAFLPTRDSSLLDVICNAAGALLGIFVFILFSLAVKGSRTFIKKLP